MPRLSKEERLQVTELIKSGKTFREVARKMKTTHSTIHRLVKKHKATGSIEDRPRSGRPRIPPVSESSWFECVGQKRPFVCTECGKTFKGLPGLKNHIKIHREDRQYQCDQCGRGFINSRSLVRHVRTHTGEKPFICEYCARGFADMGTMRTHIRTHTGERPHKCHLCDHACRSAGNLHAHMKVHRDKDGNIPHPINVQLTKAKAVPVFDGIDILRRAKRKFEKFSHGCWAGDNPESKDEEQTLSCQNTEIKLKSNKKGRRLSQASETVSNEDESKDSIQNNDIVEVKKEVVSDDEEFQRQEDNFCPDMPKIETENENCLVEDVKSEPPE